MMRVNADWHVQGPIKHIEKCLKVNTGHDFVFAGTGLYLYEERTILVVPATEVPPGDVWRKEWPEGEVFVAYIYEENYGDTILCQFAQIRVPKLIDER